MLGRECRVLLDCGATASFVSESFIAGLSLPTSQLSPPVVVNLADGRAFVAASSVSLDLTVGTLQFQVDCIPTVLAHYDVVLGKPWLNQVQS